MKFDVKMLIPPMNRCKDCAHGAVVTEEGTLQCTKDGKEIRFFDHRYRCPIGKWKSRVPPPAIQAVQEAAKERPLSEAEQQLLRDYDPALLKKGGCCDPPQHATE